MTNVHRSKKCIKLIHITYFIAICFICSTNAVTGIALSTTDIIKAGNTASQIMTGVYLREYTKNV